MATAKLILQSADSNGNKLTSTISNVQDTLLGGADISSETISNNVSILDSSMRAINNLTNNTYVDTVYQVSYSINEEAAD